MTPLASVLIDVEGAAATLLLLVPFAILAAVMFLALSKRTTGKRVRGDATVSDRKTNEAVVVRALSGGLETPSAPAAERTLDERVALAEARGDEGELAALHLERARSMLDAGRAAEGTALLQKCVLLAARAGDARVHAEARLDLAELARAAGDMTTACEHWQIARRLFFDLDRKDRIAEADALMRRHGCPTDWVLTDF